MIIRDPRPIGYWHCVVMIFQSEGTVSFSNIIIILLLLVQCSAFGATQCLWRAFHCFFPRDFCVSCWHLLGSRSLLSQHSLQLHYLHTRKMTSLKEWMSTSPKHQSLRQYKQKENSVWGFWKQKHTYKSKN